MKKKNLKSLKLNKNKISNLRQDDISGGYTTLPCYIIFKKGFEIGVSLAVCPDETDVCTSACISDNNENTCECTVA